MKNILLASMVSILSLSAFANLQKFSAQYILPAHEGSDVPESARLFEVDYFIVQENPEQLETAIFVLPQELTGKRVSVSMQVTSVDKENGVVIRQLQSSMGTAECTGPWKSIDCTYELSGIEIDEKAVNHFLNQKYGNDSEKISQMQALSRGFDADPIGVLKVQQ